MRFVDSLDDLIRFDARFFDILLQLAAKLGCRLLDLFGEHLAGAHFRLVDRLIKIRYTRANILPDLFSGVFQHQLIQRHERECRIARLNSYTVARGNLGDQPFYLDHGLLLEQAQAVKLLEPVPLHYLEPLLRHDRERAVLNCFVQRQFA